MSVTSVLTGVSLEIKSHSFCYVFMNGGTTLHPCLSFQRLACETRTTQKMGAGVEQCSHHGVSIFVIGSSQCKIWLILKAYIYIVKLIHIK